MNTNFTLLPALEIATGAAIAKVQGTVSLEYVAELAEGSDNTSTGGSNIIDQMRQQGFEPPDGVVHHISSLPKAHLDAPTTGSASSATVEFEIELKENSNLLVQQVGIVTPAGVNKLPVLHTNNSAALQ